MGSQTGFKCPTERNPPRYKSTAASARHNVLYFLRRGFCFLLLSPLKEALGPYGLQPPPPHPAHPPTATVIKRCHSAEVVSLSGREEAKILRNVPCCYKAVSCKPGLHAPLTFAMALRESLPSAFTSQRPASWSYLPRIPGPICCLLQVPKQGSNCCRAQMEMMMMMKKKNKTEKKLDVRAAMSPSCCQRDLLTSQEAE